MTGITIGNKVITYTLKNKRIYKCRDHTEWATWFSNIENRVIKQENILNGYAVSTVFLGLDHGFGLNKKPVLFETMVFDRISGDFWDDVYMERYTSYQDALNGHNRVVKRFNKISIKRYVYIFYSLLLKTYIKLGRFVWKTLKNLKKQ